jgi:hypothetical protein
MANLINNYLSNSPITIDQFKSHLPEGKNLIRNTLASTVFGVLANVTMDNQTVATFALPAFIGSFIEPATNAATERLQTFVEKKYVKLLNKNFPLQEYHDTPAYMCASAILKLALPVLVASYACEILGYHQSMLETAIKGFVLPKLATIIGDKVTAELAKREAAAAILEPAIVESVEEPSDVVILPPQE